MQPVFTQVASMNYKDRASQRSRALTPRASKGQVKFMEDLFNELGYNRATRNGYISREVGFEILYLDELTVDEATALIDDLLEQRKRKNA